MVEQSTAASRSLAQKAEALFQLIARSELGQAVSGTGPRRINETSSMSVPSPAHHLMNRVAIAIRGPAVAKQKQWEDF